VTKPNPENCKNCSSKSAYHCAQLPYTTQHGGILIIFPLNLQTSITAQTLSIGGERIIGWGRWPMPNRCFPMCATKGRKTVVVVVVKSSVTERNSELGNANASIRLFPLLTSEPTNLWPWPFACVWVVTTAHLGLKLKLRGHGWNAKCGTWWDPSEGKSSWQ